MDHQLYGPLRNDSIWVRPTDPRPHKVYRKPEPKVYTVAKQIEYDIVVDEDKLRRFPSEESLYTDYGERPELLRRRISSNPNIKPASKPHLISEGDYQFPRYKPLVPYKPKPVIPVRQKPPMYHDVVPPEYDVYVPLSSLEPRIFVHTDRDQWMPMIGPGHSVRTHPMHATPIRNPPSYF